MVTTKENKVYEEQRQVRAALLEYLKKYETNEIAAERIGVSIGDLYNWRSGYRRIPEWMCDVLGYRKAYIPTGATGFALTDKPA